MGDIGDPAHHHPDLLFGLGISFVVGIWFVLDSNRQGLHDKGANTYVVKVPPVTLD